MEWWAYNKLKPLLKKSKKVIETFKKYPEFARIDADKLRNPLRIAYFYTVAPFILLKFIIGWGSFVLVSLYSKFLFALNLKADMGSFMKNTVELGCRIVGKIGLVLWGCPFVSEKRVKVDYSKYLGPDWKLTYERPSTIISNHTNLLDIAIHMYRGTPSHVTKEAVLTFPIIGNVLKAA